jgi:lysophospholipase L1-like esterase
MWTNLLRLLTLNSAGAERLREAGGYSYSFDGIHLTEDAAQKMAEAITTFLRQNGVSG